MKICIVKTSSIGDIAHSAFLPEIIRMHMPHAVIHWYCDKNFQDILQENAFITKVHTVVSKGASNRKWQFVKQLMQLRKNAKEEKYDIVIDLQGSFKSSLIAKALCVNNHLWGFKHTRDSIASKLYNYYSHVPLHTNIYRRNLQLINDSLEMQGSLGQVTIPYLYTRTLYDIENLSQIKEKSSSKPHILIFPSSSTPTKNYSETNWQSLISDLNSYNVTLLYGNSQEKDLCNEIARNRGRVHIVGNLTLENIKGLLTRMDCVIGADTGILHMASALGIPNITLYGPTPAYRTWINAPYSIPLQGNGDVNSIPPREILQSLAFLNI